jgi:hypothetical protein
LVLVSGRHHLTDRPKKKRERERTKNKEGSAAAAGHIGTMMVITTPSNVERAKEEGEKIIDGWDEASSKFVRSRRLRRRWP